MKEGSKMKKYIALFLVVALCLALFAGCGGSSQSTTSPATTAPATKSAAEETPDSPPAAEETPDSPPAAEETPDSPSSDGFAWNGKKEVWSVLPTTGAEGLVMINDFMGEILEADGWVYAKKDAMGDPTAQVGFVEDAIAAGTVGALMVAAMAVEALQDVVQQATDAGIIVVYLGAQPTQYGINGCVYTAYELTGMWAVELAETWVNLNIDRIPTDSNGKVPIALDVYEEIQDGQYRSNGMRGRAEESDIFVIYNEGTSYGDTATTDAFNWAENLMTSNPDLRVFVCYEPEAMIGVCDYLNQYAQANGLDLADFCVVNCYTDSSTLEEHEKAVADPSSTAFKGNVTYGEEGDVETYGPVASLQATGSKLAEEILGAANGTWDWNLTFYDTIMSLPTFEGGFAGVWKDGEVNPAEKYKY